MTTKSKTVAGAHHDLARGADKIAAPTERSFGVTFAVVFALLAIWFGYRSGISLRTIAAAAAAVAFLALAYTMPRVLAPLNWAWFRFGLALHAVISPIILGMLFFAVVTPIGVVMRLLGKDLLGLKRRAPTYWLTRDPDSSGSMANQF
jgi:hypothetical protein